MDSLTPVAAISVSVSSSPRSHKSQAGDSGRLVDGATLLSSTVPMPSSRLSPSQNTPSSKLGNASPGVVPQCLLTDTSLGYPASLPPPLALQQSLSLSDEEEPPSQGLRNATRRKLQAFYQAHPGYAAFAAQHPHLNKWLLVGGTAFALVAPTVAIRSGIGHMIRNLDWWPKPQTGLQALGWISGITLGFTGLGAAVNRFSKPGSVSTTRPVDTVSASVAIPQPAQSNPG
jgi:hypothetical protein